MPLLNWVKPLFARSGIRNNCFFISNCGHYFSNIPKNEKWPVNLPENVMSENMDEIIRRSALRLE
jgi:hypothetical protein